MSALDLSEDQQDGLNALLTALDAGEREPCLTGAAGCGKTTLMRAFLPKARARGWQTRLVCPTGKAAVRLKEVTGEEVKTVHSAFYGSVFERVEGDLVFGDLKSIEEPRVLVVCDEASMLDEALYADMLKGLGPDSALLTIGDREQLPPISGRWGAPFDHPTAHLETVHRHALDKPILQVATTVRRGGKLPEGELGSEYERRSGSIETAARWLVEKMHAGEDAVVLCWTNRTRQRINLLARHVLEIPSDDKLVEGDRIVVLMNSKALGMMNGETFTVSRLEPFDPSSRIPPEFRETILGQKGRTFPTRVHMKSAGRSTALLTVPEAVGVPMQTFKEVSKRWEPWIHRSAWGAIDHGYALTVHKSQGSEFDHVCFVIDGFTKRQAMRSHADLEMMRRLTYTAVTRAKRGLLVLDVP